MLIDFIISRGVSAACYITAAVKICFMSKAIDNSIIKTRGVNVRFIRGGKTIFNKTVNIIRNTILAIYMGNKIYAALYQGIQNIMFGQESKGYAENRNKSCTPYECEGI